MEYKEFIDGINNRNGIKQIDFYVKDYPHYRSCSIGRYIDVLGGVEFDGRITCTLTKDSERISFWDKFDENCKIFDFKGKGGKKTLKECWSKIVITDIIYHNG
ncbi:MAG: hypothetical protein NC350_02925 [Corallococcus sp.]|nr:hypothetical protein [Corallococcus sp.]